MGEIARQARCLSDLKARVSLTDGEATQIASVDSLGDSAEAAADDTPVERAGPVLCRPV